MTPSYFTWNKDDPAGMAAASAAYMQAAPVLLKRESAQADASTYRNIRAPNVSVRDGFDRQDYDWFRPGEMLPVRDDEIICACMQAYERFAVVRTVIDLMADFAVKGVDVVHPRERVEKFGREWFAKVNGPERSERLLNMLYRAGNVVVKRQTASIPEARLDALRANAGDIQIKTKVHLPPNEIPLGYTILDPRAVRAIGGELSPFIGAAAIRYAVAIPKNLSERLRRPQGFDQSLVNLVPASILNAATNKDRLVPIPPNKVATLFYKKDDFQVWAKPLLYPLLDKLLLYEKMMLADRAALDGAISHIRLWKLGSLEHRIFPSEPAIQRLADMLMNNVGGGSIDLIWGPELTLEETKTDVHQFLGEAKYAPVLQAIYQGLGVPPSLTGTGKEGGFTNNVVSMKVLQERLEYGRMLVSNFWLTELELVRSRFGFREPFQLVFDQPSFTDEASMLKLFIDLADRDYVSLEALQERFGTIPEIEEVRMRRETKARKAGRLPPKAGPYHLDSQQQGTLERSFVQQGVVTPSQVGIDYQPPKAGEKTPAEQTADVKTKNATIKASKPRKPAGRPVGAKDGGGRKQKKVLPRSKAEELAFAIAWADEAFGLVEKHLKAPFLAARGHQNMRQLTAAEAAEFAGFTFATLCAVPVGARVTRESMRELLSGPPVHVPSQVEELYRAAVGRYVAAEGHPPAAEKDRQMKASVYALYAASTDDQES